MEEYELAVPYLEKALEYNPNEAFIINYLSDFYAQVKPDTKKYLEYALKGVQLNIAAYDSVTASFIYLHLSNAFVQSGFVSEARTYIDKSLQYSPDNLFAEYLKAYVLYAKSKNFEETKDLLIAAYNKDLSRLDILQEIGKIYYYMRDYKNSFSYYSKFLEIIEARQLDIYPSEYGKISVVYEEMGLKPEAEGHFAKYFEYTKDDESIYKHLSLAMYYARIDDTKQALEQLKLFSEEENYSYWTLLTLEKDPLVDNLKDIPEFNQLVKKIKTKFWQQHDEIKASLEKKGLL